MAVLNRYAIPIFKYDLKIEFYFFILSSSSRRRSTRPPPTATQCLHLPPCLPPRLSILQDDDDHLDHIDLEYMLGDDFDPFPDQDEIKVEDEDDMYPSSPTTSTFAPSTSTSGEKRTRGIVKINLVKRVCLKGKTLKSVGGAARTMSFYIGASVRKNVPIVLPPKAKNWWSSCLDQYKEVVWTELIVCSLYTYEYKFDSCKCIYLC